MVYWHHSAVDVHSNASHNVLQPTTGAQVACRVKGGEEQQMEEGAGCKSYSAGNAMRRCAYDDEKGLTDTVHVSGACRHGLYGTGSLLFVLH